MTKEQLIDKYSAFPAELRKAAQFVCWGGADKIPKNPHTGNNAQSNNPDTWGTFEQAIDACVKYNFDGVGFMFAPPYFGVDLDHCMDNTDFVDEFVETLQSYTEISKSGNGIHIICKGKLPSVTPQPRAGQWIEHFDEIGKWYECDQCHTDWGGAVNYCPNCGAKMEVEE